MAIITLMSSDKAFFQISFKKYCSPKISRAAFSPSRVRTFALSKAVQRQTFSAIFFSFFHDFGCFYFFRKSHLLKFIGPSRRAYKSSYVMHACQERVNNSDLCFTSMSMLLPCQWKYWHRAKNRLRDKTGFGM